MNTSHYQMTQMPNYLFSSQLWSTIPSSTIPESEKQILKNLLEVSLTFQVTIICYQHYL